jgi:hypothetical protein
LEEDVSPEHSGENGGTFDRRRFLKRVAVATAFVAPIVSSFSMEGVNTVFAAGRDTGGFANGSGRRADPSCFEQDHTAYGPQSGPGCAGDTDGPYGG